MFLSGVREQPLAMLKGIKVIPELISKDEVFKNFAEAKRFVSTLKKD